MLFAVVAAGIVNALHTKLLNFIEQSVDCLGIFQTGTKSNTICSSLSRLFP